MVDQPAALVYVIMGVSGCGKTTVGEALAAHLDCPFYDGDDYHPAANVAKMASGIPLNDDDRAPWLAILAGLLEKHVQRTETAVLACSALKKTYRDLLRVGDPVRFVFLEGDFDTIWERMLARENHYMKADMLHSQFETLEPPTGTDVITLPILLPVDEIVTRILSATGLS